MPNGTALDLFRPHHPARYFDVGIAEEHAVIFAAGMATKGYKPFCAIYSTFLQRAYDQIVHDVALQNLPVVFCMDRGGLSGDDGPTHHGLFDISYLRSVPNLIHMVASSEDQLADMMYTAMLYDGPAAIRYPRGTGPASVVKDRPVALEIGKAEVPQDGADVAVFALGADAGRRRAAGGDADRAGLIGGVDRPAVRQADRPGVCGAVRLRAAVWSSRWRIMFLPVVSDQRYWRRCASCRWRRRWCASVGRIGSSSMESRTS